MLQFTLEIVDDQITIEDIIITITKLGGKIISLDNNNCNHNYEIGIEANDEVHAKEIITHNDIYGQIDEDDLKLYIYGE